MWAWKSLNFFEFENVSNVFVFLSRRALLLKDEALTLTNQESLMPTVKPASLQHDVTENDEEHLFDLEWQQKVSDLTQSLQSSKVKLCWLSAT